QARPAHYLIRDAPAVPDRDPIQFRLDIHADVDGRAERNPGIEALGVGDAHADAAMRSGLPATRWQLVRRVAPRSGPRVPPGVVQIKAILAEFHRVVDMRRRVPVG